MSAPSHHTPPSCHSCSQPAVSHICLAANSSLQTAQLQLDNTAAAQRCVRWQCHVSGHRLISMLHNTRWNYTYVSTLQVLYSYPPESIVSPDLSSFCFPHGVQPTLLEHTPSMSSLNDLLYSQNYLNSEASSFIFLLKVCKAAV